MTSRVRVRRPAVAVTPAEKSRLTVLVNTVSANILIKEDADRVLKSAMSELDELMVKFNLQKHETAEGIAEYEARMGRASRTISPEQFSRAVTPEEFYDSITVSVTKAKQYMAEKELEKISTTTPAKAKDPELVVRPKRSTSTKASSRARK